MNLLSIVSTPGTWVERSSCSQRYDHLTVNAQVPGTKRTVLIFVQPASGFQVDSVHSMAELALILGIDAGH